MILKPEEQTIIQLHTIEDLFAVAALVGLLYKGGYGPEGAAKQSYDYAEAMMREKEKRSKQ